MGFVIVFGLIFSPKLLGWRRRPVVVAGPVQGKAGETGPGQTKPRLGTTGKLAEQFRAEN